MNNDVEKILRKYLPLKWTKKDFKLYLGEYRKNLDEKSINSSLNYPIRDFVLRGGKRLRPIIFLTCLDIFGVDHKKYIDFAFVIELLHNGTLVFDDIEDNGHTRRGKATCHRKFGLDIAVNAGFAMHILPLKIILSKKNDLSDKQVQRLIEIYVQESINVAYGQTLDISWHNCPSENITEKMYMEMVRLKTSSLMRMSITMACVIAKRSEKTIKAFSKFAETAGAAFQIRDDALDLINSNYQFGKVFGNDITEGKMSLPVVYAFSSNQNRKRKKRLKEILSKKTRNKKLIKEAVMIIVDSGGVEKAIDYANKLVKKAWKDLESKYSKKYDLEELKKLTLFFVERTY